MSSEERYDWLMSRRIELETEIREAEILLGLLKKHLVNVDEIFATAGLRVLDEVPT